MGTSRAKASTRMDGLIAALEALRHPKTDVERGSVVAVGMLRLRVCFGEPEQNPRSG